MFKKKQRGKKKNTIPAKYKMEENPVDFHERNEWKLPVKSFNIVRRNV